MTRRAALIFLALGVAWGIPYLLIKVAVDELTPGQLVLARTGFAALLLLPVAVARGAVLPVLRRWRPLLLYTAVEISLPWFFLSTAEQKLPSSTTGLLIAAVPLVGVALSFAGGRAEQFSVGNWVGLGLGVLGVAALVGLDVGGSDLGAVAELVVTVVGYASGPVIMARWLNDLPGIGVVAVSLTAAALGYLPIVLAADGLPTRMPSGGVVWAVVLLVVVCTAAAFLLLFALVAAIGPVRATTITYVNPAVAIVAGVIVLGEDVSVWTGIGFALVIAGSWLVNTRPATPPDTTLSAVPEAAAEGCAAA